MKHTMNGIHRPLEAAADDLLGVIGTHQNDILTPWKEQDRRKREIPVDPASFNTLPRGTR